MTEALARGSAPEGCDNLRREDHGTLPQPRPEPHYDLVLIGPNDKQALEDLFRRSTVETRYRRFHHMVKEFPYAHLADLTCRCGPYVTVAARIREGEQAGDLIGLASAATTDPDAAEVAVWVADDWQRRGVGAVLMRRLLGLLGEARVRAARAQVAYDNWPARRLLHALAPDAGLRYVDRETLEVSVSLPTPESVGGG